MPGFRDRRGPRNGIQDPSGHLNPDQRFLVVAVVIQDLFFRSLLVDSLSRSLFLTLVAKVPF